MARKSNKTITKEVNSLQFISEDEIMQEIEAAKANLSESSPYVRWAKFILTDDQPNGNGVRIPVEEFDNLIKSGIHMPIKMAEGKIEEDHSDATPIGVITNLKKEFVDGINRIVGIAALWLNERPGDVTYLKSKLDSGENVNISWEIGFSDRQLANGIINYQDVALQAATIVGNPAYRGRTRFLAIASKEKWTDAYIENLPDSSFLYVERGGTEGKQIQKRLFPVKDEKGFLDESQLKRVLTEVDNSEIPENYLGSIKETVTELLARVETGASLEGISGDVTPLENNIMEEDTVELERLTKRVSELETELANAKTLLTEKEQALAQASESLASLNGEKDSMTTELDELRKFKKDIDDEVTKVERLDAIKAKFTEASLNKDDAYFAENSEKLLSLDEDALNFMIQEFKSFASTDASASLEGKTKVPNFPGDTKSYDIHEIAKALREHSKSK